MYRRGKGVERDLQKSIGWYEAAAKQGDPDAKKIVVEHKGVQYNRAYMQYNERCY